jgi:hypothetical protein
MAALVLQNAKVVINTVDLSDHCVSASGSFAVELQESTAMGANYRTRLAGLKDLSLDLTFNQNYASGSVDATLMGALGTSVAVTFKPVNTTTSATNPEIQCNMFVVDYQPFGQSVGDKATATAKLVVNGNVTRATS